VGPDQATASDNATVAALVFAADSLAGDPREKTSAGNYVRNNLMAVMGFATKGSIFRRGFNAAGDEMSLDMFIKVNRSNLQRHLVENQVITASRVISKAAGKPKIMVIYEQGDCERGKGTGLMCTLPERIKQQAALVAQEEDKVRNFQQTIISSGCVDKVEDVAKSEGSMSDNSAGSAAHSSQHAQSVRGNSSGSLRGESSSSGEKIAGTSRRSFSGSASGSSSGSLSIRINRKAHYKNFQSSVKPSPNCQSFIERLAPMETRVDTAQTKLDVMQDELDVIRANLQRRDVTTVKINEWFVNQRWEVLDSNAVRKGQRLLDAMVNVKGLPEDPVARLAQLVGADIYVMHNAQESRAGGGYQVHVDVRAYEVVSGKLLGSKVGKSNKLASPELENATSAAVGRAMPKILDQMTAYWSDMCREGVKAKIVIRGDFSNNSVKRKITRAIDDISEIAGKRCAGKCEWEPSVQTAMTIAGEYTSPPAVRKRLGDSVIEALEEAGFRVMLVVSNQALTIVEVQ